MSLFSHLGLVRSNHTSGASRWGRTRTQSDIDALSRKRNVGHTVLPQADRKAAWPDQHEPYGCSEHRKQAWCTGSETQWYGQATFRLYLTAQEHQMSHPEPDRIFSWRHFLFFCRNHVGVWISLAHSCITTHCSAITNVVVRCTAC